MSLNSDWQRFILNESIDEKTIFTYLQGLQEIVDSMKARTLREERRITLAKQHLREVKKQARRMVNENIQLQEKLTLLEENKED